MKRITVTMLSAALCLSACKQEPREQPPSQPTKKAKTPAQLLLDTAIEATGGLEKLKAASSFTGKSHITMMGVPREATIWYKAGRWRMDYTAVLGFPYTRMEGRDDCWEKRGWPVIPCAPEMRKFVSKFQSLFRASFLWPLKEEPGWTLALGTAKQGDKERDALNLKHGEHEGTLLLDKTSHLVVGMKMEARFMGMEGLVEAMFSEHEEHCGVQMPMHAKNFFKGQLFVEEKVAEITCGPVDDKLFERPPQIKDGTVVLKKLPASKAVCLTHKGPYQGIGPKVRQLFGFLMKNRATAFARGIMIYKKAPPAVKDPKQLETEVCIRLLRPLPDKPKDYVMRDLAAVEVLAAYGIGPMGVKTKQLAGQLMSESQKRKRKPAGPLRRIMHMTPMGFPPAKLVNELQLPVK